MMPELVARSPSRRYANRSFSINYGTDKFLPRQCERRNEEHAEGGGVLHFTPPEAANDERTRLLYEVEPSSE